MIVVLGIFVFSGFWLIVPLLWRSNHALTTQSYRRLANPSPDRRGESPHTPILQVNPARIRIGHAELTVEVARDAASRARGLSGRDALPGDAGMIFIFPSGGERTFWMKDTRIPLDILWVREGTVVGMEENVQPGAGLSSAQLPRFHSPGPIDIVVEVNAGWARRMGVTVGDRVVRLP